MKLKTLLWILLVLAAGVFAAALRSRALRAVRVQNRKWRPFQAAMVERSYRAGVTAPALTQNYVYGRRRDGSHAQRIPMQILAHGGWAEQRIVEDYSTGTSTSIDPATESLTTYHFAAKHTAELTVPPGACGGDANAPHVEILGYDTVQVRRSDPGGLGGSLEVTEWQAPRLNCFALRDEAEPADGQSSRTREALLVKEGEPPAALFDLPANYTERAPSEVMAERARRFPNEPGACPNCKYDDLDKAYRSAGKRYRPPAL